MNVYVLASLALGGCLMESILKDEKVYEQYQDLKNHSML